MSRSHSQATNSFRRQCKADRLLFSGSLVMRPCTYCSIRGFLCVLGPELPHCEQCYRANRQCELAPPDAEIERLLKQERKLFGEAKETQAKAIRFNKQRRAILKRLRDLSDRENQNILELELDKMVELPSFPTESEGITDPSIIPDSFREAPRPFSPFQVSLGFSHRTPAMPFRSG
jgi:hypothetical protein